MVRDITKDIVDACEKLIFEADEVRQLNHERELYQMGMPRSRGTDPATSHQAEAEMRSGGKLNLHQNFVLELLRHPPGLFDIPRSRGTDPATSREAEAEMRSRGKLNLHQNLVLELLRQRPGSTAKELDKIHILDGIAHRRLVELERKGLVRRGEPRRSEWHHSRANTWWPK